MEDYDKIYERLIKIYTAEEIAESMLIPKQNEDSEAKKIREEFVKLRMQRREKLSDKDKLLSNLLSLKYQMKAYIKSNDFNPEKTFASFLKKYVVLLDQQQKQFAENINIHPSRLNRILKGKERIGKKIAYRLEQHSGSIIPALFWWKLVQKEIEEEIITDIKEREIEKKNVKNNIFRA